MRTNIPIYIYIYIYIYNVRSYICEIVLIPVARFRCHLSRTVEIPVAILSMFLLKYFSRFLFC
jgi:hypothetical protein